METTEQTRYLALVGDKTAYDVIVVADGMTSIVTAYFLQRRGMAVALVEKGRIAEWKTGGTSVKLTSQHYLLYDYLLKHHGKDTMSAFAQADQNGIDEVE